ncbi:uncharacterized protein LOC109047373 isoform X2 [Cyprinus carpio]|uniref:Uncharacterized LOC109047373 n=2 Tax=Cyprinus carpio TaxID=7962 RepID=A0A8C1TFX3_CYPCA|nr:uncharacterized protein LOC109047373 isoform X2 [Cyprinus carpio]XP_042580922.1 uncharacterized protein LOC109047373 isoform X2 [Cyprinus carpio]XP_042580923.1 uncharacterized protein LOC109047373 isoform X2 [Cyprinus carpio]
MAESQKLLLRVYIAPDIAHKMTLSTRPSTVEELITVIKEKFRPRLDFDFNLQYEDPDFGGQLCFLTDISELPEKAVLKVHRSETDAGSASTSDTEILPYAPERLQSWPDVFPVPQFSYDVEHSLNGGNMAYQNSGKFLKLTKGQKHDILENMAKAMHSFKAYPSDKEVAKAAEALISKHPCLTEPGSQCGWYGWKTSLKFKMGNFRTKLSRSGCEEVAVNSGKRSKNNPESESPHSNIKRARRAEVNYLPNFPKGESAESLEQQRLQIVEEVSKTERSLGLIERLMQSTFALRRKQIVVDNPSQAVKEFLEKWPALRLESQIAAEFHRITNISLKNKFYAELDNHTPRLIAVYRQKAARTGKAAEALRSICSAYDLTDHYDINNRRTVALRALPVYFREDDSVFFKMWNTEELDEPDIADSAVALVSMVNGESSSTVQFDPAGIAIVLEGDIVLRDISRLADAFLLMFGLIYALHLNYPKELTHTFNFIQKVLLGLDDSKPLTPRLLSLKNELLIKE